jgi:hypothetical protein
MLSQLSSLYDKGHPRSSTPQGHGSRASEAVSHCVTQVLSCPIMDMTTTLLYTLSRAWQAGSVLCRSSTLLQHCHPAMQSASIAKAHY